MMNKIESKLTKKTGYFQCPHNNTGYCKFREKCFYQHFYSICSKTVCKNFECQNRHPKTCKFGESCKFKSKNCCAYKHAVHIEKNNSNTQHVSHTNYDSIKKENQYLRKQVEDLQKVLSEEMENVKTLKTEVDTLREDLKAKTTLIDGLEKQSRETNLRIRKETIQCSLCNSAIPSEETLEEHLLKSHSVDCQKCDKTFKSEQKLKLHISFDHKENEKVVSCKKCNFLFQTHEDFKNHLSGLQHNETKKFDSSEESDDDDEYLDACGLCGIIFYSFEEMDDHQSNYIRCEKCSICFHNEFQWKNHEICDD